MQKITPDIRAELLAKRAAAHAQNIGADVYQGEPVSHPAPSSILALRTKAGLSRARAAALIGYSGSMLQQWEQGSRLMPRELFLRLYEATKGMQLDDSQDVGKERQLWANHFASLKALELYYANKRTMDGKRATTEGLEAQRHAELLGV